MSDYQTFTMTQTDELTNARQEVAKARQAWNQANTRKATREAAEVLEFWTNKVAFLAPSNLA